MTRNRTIDLRKIIIFTVVTVSVLLTLCFLLEGPLNTIGRVFAAEKVYYISEVKVFQAEKEADARKACESEGYQCSNRDLNAGTGEDAIILGYKLTENRDEARYDIRLLQMNDGYKIKNYAEANEELEKSNYGPASTMYASASEFAVNYENNSPKAMEAYEGLNTIHIPEENNMLLGDYIVQGKSSVEFFAKVITHASTGVINSITNYLSAGLTPMEKTTDEETRQEVDVTWADAVKDSALWDIIESEDTTQDELDDYDKEMGDDAQEFFKQLQLFTTNLENGQAVYDEESYLSGAQNANAEETIDNTTETTEADSAFVYVKAYDFLNQYEAFEGMPLGEYLAGIGRETAESVNIRRLYPVLDAMSYAQRKMVGMAGPLSLIANLGENRVDNQAKELIDKSKEKVSELTGQESISIWINTDPDMANKKVAFTSDSIRSQAAVSLVADQANNKWEEDKEIVNTVIKWCNIASSALSAISMIIGNSGVGMFLGAQASAAVAATTAATTVSKFAAFASVFGMATFVFSLVVLAFTLVFAIVSLIMDYYEKHKAQDYTDMPDYVVDVRTVNNRDVNVIYKAVMDNRGRIADLNAYKAHDGWVCVYTSADPNSGSPIRTDENGDVINIVYGESGKLPGYDCAAYFGQVTPGNCNNGAEDDDVDGVYLHFYTEKSLKNRSGAAEPETGGTVKDKKEYYKDFVVMSGKTAAVAKSKITAKEYKIFDRNLSPDARDTWQKEEQYVYIGYETTTNPALAVRDIRVATNSPEGPVKFGEISYACAGTLGFPANKKEENKNYPGDLDGLYYTSNANAGTPIEVGNLHLVTDHSQAQAGWEPVTTFSGVPYNFNTTRTNAPVSSGYNAYAIQFTNKWENKKTYLYYEPEVTYTEGTKYLSGVFFGFATDVETSAEYNIKKTVTKAEDLFNTLSALPNVCEAEATEGVNLSQSYSYSSHSLEEGDQKYLRLYYTWSYNPYRALTDVEAYRGSPYLSALPYTIEKALTYPAGAASSADTGASYAAASIVVQRLDENSWAFRALSPSNAYMAPNSILESEKTLTAIGAVNTGYTEEAQGGFTESGRRMPLLPTNLYVSGYVKGRARLTLDDVVISKTKHDGVRNNSAITCDISGETTLGGAAAEGDFCSIQDLKDPYCLTAFNISYPSWYFGSADRKGENDHKAGPSVYIYVRHEVVKKRYISRIFVGASARDDAKSDDSDVLKNYDKSVDLNAMVAATSAASDEVILTDAAGDPEKAWYNYLNYPKDGTNPNPPKGGDPAAYISVARTDDATKAIRGVVLYQSTATAVPEMMQIDSMTYYCVSNTKPIRMNNGKKYYIYYTYNIGAVPGKPITELDISDQVFVSGCSTALVVDKADTTEIRSGKVETVEVAKGYGDTSMSSFIHAKYEAGTGYFNKLLAASGKTAKEAQLKLLEQGCTEFCDIDLNKGAGGSCVYFGYRSISLDESAINALKTEDAREKERDSQLYEAVYDIVCTVGEEFRPDGFVSERHQIYYTPVAEYVNGEIVGTNLNEGTTGPAIYMYYTSTCIAKEYNERVKGEPGVLLSTMPKDYLSSPLTKIGFALYDYVPYSQELAAASSGADELTPWEYVMNSNNKTQVNLNEGAVLFDNDHMMHDNRLTMFAQRASGSVKPSAEITGGYNTALVAESKLYNNK